MESIKVKRKKKRRTPGKLFCILAACAAFVCVVLVAVQMNRPTEIPAEHREDPDGAGNWCVHEAADVASLSVTLRSGERWTLLQNESGDIRMADAPGFDLNIAAAENLLQDAAVIGWREVVSRDPGEYMGRLTEFGLGQPAAEAHVLYRDGSEVSFSVGDMAGVQESPFYYMMIQGSEWLLALDVTTAEDLTVERALLHRVVQPTIHAARIDSITVSAGDGAKMAWKLDGEVTDSDAQDRWLLTAPLNYPADGERISGICKNLSNFRLGAYVDDLTPENAAAFGMEQPRHVITLHMAGADMATTNAAGERVVSYCPEETVELLVGGSKSDMVDYVAYRGKIYVTSRFSLETLTGVDPADTLTRYPVLTAMSNLRVLTVTEQGKTVRYEVTRTEQVAPNNELVLDENGDPVYDVTVTCDGREISREAFENAYQRMLMTTVTGTLPADWVQTEPLSAEYVFETVTGMTHTIGLTRMDAMHDAVLVDGYAAFYLVRGGLTLEI